MNSVIQQLFMTPGIYDNLLAVDTAIAEDNSRCEDDEETVLFQLQQVMGHLLDSKLQYYVPDKFWKVTHCFHYDFKHKHFFVNSLRNMISMIYIFGQFS